MAKQKQEQYEITVEELKKRKLFIATPMYGGVCHGFYASSILYLTSLFNSYGMNFRYYCLQNESLITRARNYCVDEFLRSDCTHFLFIDSDIEFDPKNVLSLLAIADPASDKDIVCAPYPKKNISWEKIKSAVDKGHGDLVPDQLQFFAGDMVFNPVKAGEYNISEPIEVLESGTGFMMIQRRVFEDFAKAHPELSYRPDHIRTNEFDGSREITAFFNDPVSHIDYYRQGFIEIKKNPEKAGEIIKEFEDKIKKDSKRFLSEDYYFCQEIRKLGRKVWLCPWLKLNHMGTYKFIGDMQAIAAIGASPTVDPSKLGKKKNG